MTDEAQLRRDITAEINIALRQLHDAEKSLAVSTLGESARIIASCEVASLQMRYGLLQEALSRTERADKEDATCFTGAPNGYVQGQGHRVDSLELATARLVKAMREAAWLPPLPWAWESFQTPGNVLHFGRAISMGRYLIADVPGVLPGPRMMAYLVKAGAMFPSMVREIVALRIALVEAGCEGKASYGAAEALIAGVREPAQGGTSEG